MQDRIVSILSRVRETRPLVQVITNYVTINDLANVLLCAGASPVMCENPVEMEQFVPLASALVLNLGTLTEEQKAAMRIAVRVAGGIGKPIVLDPVGYGAIDEKARFIEELGPDVRWAVIKGNYGEIVNLAGLKGEMRGVDSLAGEEHVALACRTVAARYGCVVAATGPEDYVAAAGETWKLSNGHPMLGAVSGTGCMVGALVGACMAAADGDGLAAVAAGISLLAVPGELVGNDPSLYRGPASYKTALLDQVALTEAGRYRDLVRCRKLV